jgi:hypothetical protein
LQLPLEHDLIVCHLAILFLKGKNVMRKTYFLLTAATILGASLIIVSCSGKKPSLPTGSSDPAPQAPTQTPQAPKPTGPATCISLHHISETQAANGSCPQGGTDPQNDDVVRQIVKDIKENSSYVVNGIITKVGPYRDALIERLASKGFCAQFEPGGELGIRKTEDFNDLYNVITTGRGAFTAPQSHCQPAIIPFTPNSYAGAVPSGGIGGWGCGLPGSRTGAQEISCFREDPTYLTDLRDSVEEIIKEHDKKDADGKDYNDMFTGCPGGICLNGNVGAFYTELFAKLDKLHYCSYIPADVQIGGELSLKRADGNNAFSDLFQVLTSAAFVRTHSAGEVVSSSNETATVLAPEMLSDGAISHLGEQGINVSRGGARAWLNANETMTARQNRNEHPLIHNMDGSKLSQLHAAEESAGMSGRVSAMSSSSDGLGSYRSTCWPADF